MTRTRVVGGVQRQVARVAARGPGGGRQRIEGRRGRGGVSGQRRRERLEGIERKGPGHERRDGWRWRPIVSRLELREGLEASDIQVSPSGRRVALRGSDAARLRDGVLIYPNGTARRRWRTAVTGVDRYLELGAETGSVDVLGDRLIVQNTRALVVDLAGGVVTHNVQRGGQSELGEGKLVPGFAVFALPGLVGVALLR